MMRRFLVLLELLLAFAAGLAAPAEAGPTQPKLQILLRRKTASGGYQYLTGSNATVTVYPASGDTTGKGEVVAYSGDYVFVYMADSTGVFDFYETGGTGGDSLCLGGDNIVAWGPDMLLAREMVGGSAFVAESNGRFFPLVPFQFSDPETLFVRRLAADSTGHAIILQGTTSVDTLNADGPVRLGTAAGDSLVGDGSWNARGGYLKIGTDGRGSTLRLSDGSSNAYTFIGSASSVNWSCPMPIYADTINLKITRAGGGDRRTSKYVPGLLATDIVDVHVACWDCVGSSTIASRWSFWAKNDSLCFTWYSTWDTYVANVVIFRAR